MSEPRQVAETDQVDWPCDNYTEPVTCLSAGASETGTCRICRIRAADRIVAAMVQPDLAYEVAVAVHQYLCDWDAKHIPGVLNLAGCIERALANRPGATA